MALLRQCWKVEGWKPRLSEEIRHPCMALKTLVSEHGIAGCE